MSQPFELRSEAIDAGRCVVAVRGDLDVATAPHLRRALQRAADQGARLVIVDLTECDFVDSSGLGALFHGVRWLSPGGGELAIVGVGPFVARALTLAGFDHVAPFFASREQALADERPVHPT